MEKKALLPVMLLACLWIFAQGALAQEISQVCSACNGKGAHECSLCEGKGKWKAETNGKKNKITCPECQGSEVQACWLCGGSGKAVEAKTPQTNSKHPDGYSWVWCSTCKQRGVICCSRCGGRGRNYTADGQRVVCQLCDGFRYVLCTSCKGTCGWYAEKQRCNVCGGNGVQTCASCDGRGWLPPASVDRARAEVCKKCLGHGMVSHKDCGGKGCKHCKNGQVKCTPCKGQGAIIVTAEPNYKECGTCKHKGVQNCANCVGRGYVSVTETGIVLK